MSNTRKRATRRALAGATAGLVALSGVVSLTASPAVAQEGFELTRVAGDDRFETAAAIALATAADLAPDTVVVANGLNFPDALAGSYVAGLVGAPILLVQPDAVPEATLAALTEIDPDNIIVLGGTAAVSGNVATRLGQIGTVTRIAGADRYETAEEVATAGEDDEVFVDDDGNRTVFLATGENFADALAAGPVSYALQVPIVLTMPNALSTSAREALAELQADRVIVLGGTAAVSDEVTRALTGLQVDRLAGANRAETAALIAELAVEEFGFELNQVGLANGSSFADALAAAPHAAVNNFPLLLTQGANVLGDATEEFLTENAVTLQDGFVYGGPQAVSDEVIEEAEAAAGEGDGGTEGAVTVTNANVTQGGPVAGSITGDVESVTVSGAGFTNQALTDADAAAAGFQFSQNLAANAPTGQQTLTFTIRLADGTTVTRTASVTVAAATSNQTLAVTPTTPETLTVEANAAGGTTGTGEATANPADNRQYTVTGLNNAEEYRITLVRAANVTVAANGQVTFQRDVDNTATTTVDESTLAATGSPAADIVSVNGVAPVNRAQDAGSTTTNTINASGSAVATPVNGSITFVVDGDTAESVVPVVYLNGGTGQTAAQGGTNARLELDANGAPTEPFGVGGVTNFVLPAATSQVVAANTVVAAVNREANQLSAGGFTFAFDANDVFSVGGVPVNLAGFVAQLSAGDEFAANYSADPAVSSRFDLEDLDPAAPSAVSAEKGGAGAENDITVTVTLANTNSDSVVIQRAPVANGTDEQTDGTVGTYATVGTVAVGSTSTVTFVDNDVAVGAYRYRAAVVNDGDQSVFTAATTNETATAPATDETGPLAVDALQVTSAGLAGVLDQGDVISVVFNEAIGAPAAGDTLRVRDDEAADSVGDLVNGTNATFALNAAAVTVNGVSRAANTVLTVTLTGAPTVVTAGTTAGIAVPAVIVDQAGTADVAGNNWAVATAGQDVTLELDANDNVTGTASFTAAASGNTVVFTSSQPLTGGTVAQADFTEASAQTITGATYNATNRTITVTLSGALASTETVTLTADSVEDAEGRTAPGTAVVFTAP